ncbi:SUKH-3 domain-containing protein [Cryptosporangium phraense]|uniref:SUKH-3 domain-containing protein n=1 Tax=Cryptosporangium phraense TaxID=2593070 RepID=UPI0014795BC4|nr:SUKH-3 domain-containing protein [Cryptosporangium phraense]
MISQASEAGLGCAPRGPNTLIPNPAVIARGIPVAHRDAAVQRWDPFTAEALLGAGWFPGRRLPDEVLDAYDAYLRRLEVEEICLGGDEPIHWELVDAARDVLREFGGLIVNLKVPGSTWRSGRGEPVHIPDRVYSAEFFPPLDYADTEMYWDVQDNLGQLASPVARDHQSNYEVLVAADGTVLVSEVYLEFGGAEYLAASFDDALPMIVRLTTHVGPCWVLADDAVFLEEHEGLAGRSLPMADVWPVVRERNAAWIERWDQRQVELKQAEPRPSSSRRSPKRLT